MLIPLAFVFRCTYARLTIAYTYTKNYDLIFRDDNFHLFTSLQFTPFRSPFTKHNRKSHPHPQVILTFTSNCLILVYLFFNG